MSQNENSNYLPIFLDIENQHVLLIGGGKVAQRKLEVLLNYNLLITIVCPEINESLKALIENHHDKITLLKENFKTHHIDLQNFKLIFVATNNEKLNNAISKTAQSKGILANVVTSLNESHFIMPAIIQEGPFQIAISTSGNSPLLAKKVKEDISKNYLPELKIYTELLGNIRLYIKENTRTDSKSRQEIYNIVLNSTDLLANINAKCLTIEQAITEIIQKLENK